MKCKHHNLIYTDKTAEGIVHPVLCEDCYQIVECEHIEIDMANDFNEPTCVDCLAHGTDVYEPIEWDKYERD